MTIEDVLKEHFWAMLKSQAALQVEVSRLQALVPPATSDDLPPVS